MYDYIEIFLQQFRAPLLCIYIYIYIYIYINYRFVIYIIVIIYCLIITLIKNIHYYGSDPSYDDSFIIHLFL